MLYWCSGGKKSGPYWFLFSSWYSCRRTLVLIYLIFFIVLPLRVTVSTAMLCDGLCYQSSFIDDVLITSTLVSKKEKPLIAQFKTGGLDKGEFCIVFELVWERKLAFHCQLCVVFIPQQFREVRLNPFFLVCYSLNKIPSSRQIMKSVLMHEAFWGRWLASWKTDRFLFFLFSLRAFSQHRENIKQNKAIIAPDELRRYKGDVTVVKGVCGPRVFIQHSAIYCSRRRGMETSCLHFQLCQWAQVCVWTVVSPLSVALSTWGILVVGPDQGQALAFVG